MAVVLFDMFPAHGHYNGSFALAQLLTQSGYSVYYACSADFQQKVHSYNISSFVIDPFIVLPFKIELKEKGFLRYFIENIAGIFNDKKNKHIEETISHYDKMIGKLKPNLIILDEHYAYKSIFYWKYSIPQVTIQTALSPDYDPYIPPWHSTYVPKISTISRLHINYLWQKHKIKSGIELFLNRLLSLGKHSGKYYSLYAKKYSFPYKQELLKPRALGIRFGHIPSLVVPPEGFDFPRILNINLFNIGPIHVKQSNNQVIEGRLKLIIEETNKEKAINPRARLIYCSLGTVTAEYLKICKRFFKHIGEVCLRNQEWKIVLSVGTFFNISEIPSIPQNLYIFDKVPQLALLEHCDVVINHGGMNTIYECIMAEKPMVVYPLSLKVDQNGNAARVVYHNIGVKGVIRRSTTRSIEILLKQILDREDYYVQHVRELKSKFIDKSSYTLELIDYIIKKETHVKQNRNQQTVC